jgi:hypothetical protein
LELDCEIHSPNLGGAASYNQNLIHFLLTVQGWSDTPKRLVILQYGVYTANEITIGSIGAGDRGGTNCIWVRGGMKYRFYCNQPPTLRTSAYTYDNQVFSVGTGYNGSGSNTNVITMWTPDTSISAEFSGALKASSFVGNATTATTANKIRTSTPSSPQGMVRSVLFNPSSVPASGYAPPTAYNSSTSGFTNGHCYVVYFQTGGYGYTSTSFNNYANYNITIGTGINFS